MGGNGWGWVGMARNGKNLILAPNPSPSLGTKFIPI